MPKFSVDPSIGFLPSDDNERWVPVYPGVPLSQLVRGVAVAGTGKLPVGNVVSAGGVMRDAGLFEVMPGVMRPGTVRSELVEIDTILEQRNLDPMDVARVLTRLMNWEEGAGGAGKCTQANVTLARLRQSQPIGDTEYRAVLRVLAMTNAMIQTHVHSILTRTRMPKPGRVPSWDGR